VVLSGQINLGMSNDYTYSGVKPLESKLVSSQQKNKEPYRSSTTTRNVDKKGFHLKPMDASDTKKPNLTKKAEKSVRDHLVDQLVARDAIHSILHSTLEGSKPKIVFSSPSENPAVRYVRRIKNNDFWNGKNAEKQHGSLISPYS